MLGVASKRRQARSNGVVTGPVIEVVKGGLIVDIGLRGFLPASLVELRRVRDLASPMSAATLEAKIIELDKNRNNVVLSPGEPGWRRAEKEEREEGFLRQPPAGASGAAGRVSSVVSFGAFVDLGGMDGLIHVSELSWKHVDHPSSVVHHRRSRSTVEVLEIDRERERISPVAQGDAAGSVGSVRQLSHRVEELVYGRVTKLVPFGAFVQVGESIEGLVHISEMSAHHVELPEQVVTPGEELWVKIIDLDINRRRISLSIKQAAEGGVVAAEFQEHFGEHAYDAEGNYIGAMADDVEADQDEAWAQYYSETGEGEAPAGEAPAEEAAPVNEALVEEAPAEESPAGEAPVAEAQVEEASAEGSPAEDAAQNAGIPASYEESGMPRRKPKLPGSNPAFEPGVRRVGSGCYA